MTRRGRDYSSSVADVRPQPARRHESHLIALRIGAQHPRHVLHVVQGRVVAVDILGVAGDPEADAAADAAAVDDFVAQARALDDGSEAAGEAERWLTVIDGAAANSQAHRSVL